MKVFILAGPRTKSSFFQDVISKFYNVNNLSEPLYTLSTNFADRLKFYDANNGWRMYLNYVTDNNVFVDNSSIKILSSQIINPNIWFRKNFYNTFKLEKKDTMPLISTFRLEGKEKIFVLQRNNIVDQILSWYYQRQIGYRTHFLKSSDENFQVYKPDNKILPPLPDKIVKSEILHLLFLQSIPNFLSNQGYNVTSLEYSEIEKYLFNHKISIESEFIQTDFDYTKLKNYDIWKDTILNFIEEIKSVNNFSSLLS